VGSSGHANFAGRAYVFARRGAVWKQVAELRGSDTVAGDGFGDSVAISGRTVVVSAPAHAYAAGRAYVFAKSGAGWTQTAELRGSDTVANDLFGDSVAISGTTVVVGSAAHSYDGQAYVFNKTPAGWEQTAELNRSDSWPVGLFGWSVAISGTTVVVGAPGKPKLPGYPGRAYVFAA
jgi:hypothetical protein